MAKRIISIKPFRNRKYLHGKHHCLEAEVRFHLLYRNINWQVPKMFLKWRDILHLRKPFATPFIIYSYTLWLYTLRNISFYEKNNGKLPPLSLIPYTPYTNLQPSFHINKQLSPSVTTQHHIQIDAILVWMQTNVTHFDAYINIMVIAASQK